MTIKLSDFGFAKELNEGETLHGKSKSFKGVISADYLKQEQACLINPYFKNAKKI